MRRWVVALMLVAGTVLAGCQPANEGAPQPVGAGWPTLPASVTVDGNAPPLPGSGALGRGALLLHGTTADILVLEDGRQFRLPEPPPGEGRWGAVNASLSPDGWWFGIRTMHGGGDPGYELRSLANGRVFTGTGPVVWSVDSRWALLGDTVIDLSTGARHSAGEDTPGAYLTRDILPSGELLRTAALNHYSVRLGLRFLVGDDPPFEIRSATDPEVACWCPASGTIALSPDGMRVTVELTFHPGIKPGTTDVKVPEPRDQNRQVVVLDRHTGAELRRATLAETMGTPHLAGDRGSDLLFTVAMAGRTDVVALDPISGEQHVVTTGPDRWVVVIPGQRTPTPDG